MFWRLLGALDLTAEQRRQVVAIRNKHEPALRELGRRVRAAREELAAKLFGPGEATEGDLGPQIERIARAQRRLLEEGLRVALEVRAVLTDEQRAKAARLRGRLRALRKEMQSLLKGDN
jgi:Spy/CpxP family protein refolding chaperone